LPTKHSEFTGICFVGKFGKHLNFPKYLGSMYQIYKNISFPEDFKTNEKYFFLIISPSYVEISFEVSYRLFLTFEGIQKCQFKINDLSR